MTTLCFSTPNLRNCTVLHIGLIKKKTTNRTQIQYDEAIIPAQKIGRCKTILWSCYPQMGTPTLVKLYPVMNLLLDAVSFLLVERCELCQSLTCYTGPYVSHANPFSLQFRIYVCQWAHGCLLPCDWWAQTWHVCKKCTRLLHNPSLGLWDCQ